MYIHQGVQIYTIHDNGLNLLIWFSAGLDFITEFVPVDVFIREDLERF